MGKSFTYRDHMGKKYCDQLDQLAQRSNRSRNELINLALEYALKNVKFVESTGIK